MREGVRAEIGSIAPIEGLRGVAVLWVVAFHYVVLREAADTDGKTAALVTPDRALAARVLAALERWKVPVSRSTITSPTWMS